MDELKAWKTACASEITRFIEILFRRRRPLSEEPDVETERNWYLKEFDPQDGRPYSFALKHSEKRYEETKEVFANLDKKAEWLFGIGMLSISAIYALSQAKNVNLAYGLPSFIFVAIALFCTIRARMPGERPSAMSARHAIERVENTTDPEPWMCASLHCAIVSMKKVIDWKADQLKNASIATAFAILFVPTMYLSSPEAKPAFSLEFHSSLGANQPAPSLDDRASAEGEVHLRFGHPLVQPVLSQPVQPRQVHPPAK